MNLPFDQSDEPRQLPKAGHFPDRLVTFAVSVSGRGTRYNLFALLPNFSGALHDREKNSGLDR